MVFQVHKDQQKNTPSFQPLLFAFVDLLGSPLRSASSTSRHRVLGDGMDGVGGGQTQRFLEIMWMKRNFQDRQ